MGGGPKRRNADEQVSTCKVCLRGIYKDQKALWMHRPLIGLVHEACAPTEAEVQEL